MANYVFARTDPKRSGWSRYAKSARNFAWLRYAIEFDNAAKKAGDPIVKAFLLGQALELYLKTYLLSHGYEGSRLKKEFRHNLKKLLKAVLDSGLESKVHISPKLVDDVAALNAVYASKALQYFEMHFFLTSPRISRSPSHIPLLTEYSTLSGEGSP
jgi:hypothetical protein